MEETDKLLHLYKLLEKENKKLLARKEELISYDREVSRLPDEVTNRSLEQHN